MTGEVWPEVDRAFQRFLALSLIDCDIDVEANGASSTFTSRLHSLSPDPVDSVGSLYPDGWKSKVSVDKNAASCTNIVVDDKVVTREKLYCDVVTGSITFYLSETVTFMNAASDPSLLFLQYRDDAFQLLRDDIDEGSEGISNYLDESLGIRDLYFLSESINLNLRPTLEEPDLASNQASASESQNQSTPSKPAILASLATLATLTIVGAAFVLRRKKQNLNELDETLKHAKTPRMDDDEIDFYGPDEFYGVGASRGESTNGAVFDSSKSGSSKKFFPSRGSDLNKSRDTQGDVSNHCTSFDYSEQGVSMVLQSPDWNKSIYNPRNFNLPSASSGNVCNPRPDPSIGGNNQGRRRSKKKDPEEDQQDHPDDESSTAIQSPSNHPGEEKSLFSASGTPRSMVGSPALNYILSLGSNVLSSPARKPYDEDSSAPDDNYDAESLSTTASSLREPPPSINTSLLSEVGERSDSFDYARTALSPGFSEKTRSLLSSTKSRREHSFHKHNSPNSLISGSIYKTPSPRYVTGQHPGESIEENRSSVSADPGQDSPATSECSDKPRLNYLKNRRKDLENRFQNYRRSLSETMNNLREVPSGSWVASREFSRTVSICKNSDKSFSSPGDSLSNTVLEEGTFSADDADSKLKPEKRQSLSPQAPRGRKNHTSLNEMEEILDREETLRIASLEIDDEKERVGRFLSSHNFQATSQRKQDQTDTFIL